jgi:RNA polymerase sigma-70 factor (ECF subfamily)
VNASDAARERLRVALLKNGPDLLAYLERRIELADDAADVLSETMLVAWRKVTSLPVDPLRARMWLFVTARNCLSNHARSARRRDVLSATLRAGMEMSARQSAVDENEAARDVRDAVDRLPTDQRELVKLIHWDGFSIVDAAKLAGTKASTARTRYAAARATLRTMLADEADVRVGFERLEQSWLVEARFVGLITGTIYWNREHVPYRESR